MQEIIEALEAIEWFIDFMRLEDSFLKDLTEAASQE